MTIKDLNELIKNMNPKIIGKNYVFCTVKEKINLDTIMIFKEKEGFTYILKKQEADENNLSYKGEWDMITLNVNSDLEAVGFLAKITKALANANISVNTVSAYYHDHLFVPSLKSEEVLKVLNNLTK